MQIKHLEEKKEKTENMQQEQNMYATGIDKHSPNLLGGLAYGMQFKKSGFGWVSLHMFVVSRAHRVTFRTHGMCMVT